MKTDDMQDILDGAKIGNMRKRTEKAAVTRKTLPEQIVDYIRDRIAGDVFKPGQKLTTQAMAEELNVSMTPVREAFKTLAALGLVDMIPNRGVVVARLDTARMTHMLTVYSRLDMLGGELAAENATRDDVEHLRKLVVKLLRSVEDNDQTTYFHTNQEFHSTLVRISRNPVLIEMHDNLNSRLYSTRFRGMREHNSEDWKKVALEHIAIVDAVENHDADRVAALLKAHFKGAWLSLEKASEEEPDAEASAAAIEKPDAAGASA